LGHSTAYYPQGNGLAESSNKTLVNIIKKTLQENKKLLVVEPDYLPDSEVLAFSRVYTP
jgi:hypothetical protein